MSMSDCIKCWDTPCSCGYDYLNYSLPALQLYIDMLLGVKQIVETMPLATQEERYAAWVKSDVYKARSVAMMARWKGTP